MANPERIDEERDPPFISHLNLCWDMDGGLFPTTLACFQYLDHPSLPLPSWQKEAISRISSNQITQPYVDDWVAGYPTKQIGHAYLGPEWFCPPDICKKHLELIAAAKKAYNSLWPSLLEKDNYRQNFIEAISLKIAAMIAITHQVLYEGKVTKKMVYSTYHPYSKWRIGQKEIIAPDLASGLAGAFKTLIKAEMDNDERIAYLFKLPFSFRDKRFIFF